jgi:multiple sugar transport system substrate-binding protein
MPLSIYCLFIYIAVLAVAFILYRRIAEYRSLKHGVEWTVFAIIIATAINLLLFGPHGKVDVPRGRTMVTYWEKWTGNESAQIQEIVKDFNDTVGAEKGIFVHYLSVSSVDQKSLLAIAAGVPPDVIGAWVDQLASFAAQDAILPLDEVANANGITRDYYKKVYWDACSYQGKLYGLCSTPWATALHYNRRIFAENADALRKAGLDPNRAPRTIAELDKYAEVLDEWVVNPTTGKRQLKRAGFLPLEPGWYNAILPYWWGGCTYDAENKRLNLTDPRVVAAYEWVRRYSERLGKDSLTEFRSAFGQFDSPQNPFLSGQLAMLLQGDMMANYIMHLRPEMYRWNLPKDAPTPTADDPLEYRREHCEWAAAPFPSFSEDLKDVTFANFDILMVPKGARHSKEAMEFICFVNTRKEMEKLTNMHSKNSCLREVSPEYIKHHSNPYIDVFEKVTSSPNARSVPSLPILAEVNNEIYNAVDKVYLLQQKPIDALRQAQKRLQPKLERFLALQAKRHPEGSK